MVTVYGIPNCDTVKKARAWLNERGGAKVTARGLGSRNHGPLSDAPGTYVLEAA